LLFAKQALSVTGVVTAKTGTQDDIFQAATSIYRAEDA
jgi:hypothetical protein